MADETNPYEAPQTSIGSPQEAVQYSRWWILRWIPACFFGLMAIYGVLGSIAMAVLATWFLVRNGSRVFETRSSGLFLNVCKLYGCSLLLALVCFFGVLSTRAWYHRRWKYGIAYGVMLFLSLVNGRLLAEQIPSARLLIDENPPASRLQRP